MWAASHRRTSGVEVTHSLDDYPLMLTVAEACGLLRIGRTACYEAIRCGDIPSIKVGSSIRVPRHRLMLDGAGGETVEPTPEPSSFSHDDGSTVRRAARKDRQSSGS